MKKIRIVADSTCDLSVELIEKYDIDAIDVFEPSLNDIFVEYAGAQV